MHISVTVGVLNNKCLNVKAHHEVLDTVAELINKQQR